MGAHTSNNFGCAEKELSIQSGENRTHKFSLITIYSTNIFATNAFQPVNHHHCITHGINNETELTSVAFSTLKENRNTFQQ